MNNSELPNILLRDMKGEGFEKGTVKFKIFSSLADKEVENLDGHGCAKDQDLVHNDMWIGLKCPF